MTSAQAPERFARFVPLIICVGLLALTWFVFGQTLRFDFVNYDDPEWVSKNPHVVAGLTKDGMVWALQRWQAGPLSSISHMVFVAVFGLNPAGHHFTNVLLHSLAVVLL